MFLGEQRFGERQFRVGETALRLEERLGELLELGLRQRRFALDVTRPRQRDLAQLSHCLVQNLVGTAATLGAAHKAYPTRERLRQSLLLFLNRQTSK